MIKAVSSSSVATISNLSDWLATNCEKLSKKQVEQGISQGGGKSIKWLESAVDFDLGADQPILKSFLVNKS